MTEKSFEARVSERVALITRFVSEIDGLYDAIAEGLRTPGLREKLEALEARKAELEALIAADLPLVFHPAATGAGC